MTRMPSAGLWSVALALGLSALGCTPGGVGDPCTPEDEYQQNFSGFQETETNVESRSFQCETRLCLVNHFRGRVSCRVGQGAQDGDYHPKCSIPGTVATTDRNDLNNINVKVPAQLVERQTEKAVYCSCRCDGPDKNAKYCECPEGFECSPLVDNLKITAGSGQLAGSYCIRTGTRYDSSQPLTKDCDQAPGDCGCSSTDPKTRPAECGGT
jgi:hypothetical protein